MEEGVLDKLILQYLEKRGYKLWKLSEDSEAKAVEAEFVKLSDPLAGTTKLVTHLNTKVLLHSQQT